MLSRTDSFGRNLSQTPDDLDRIAEVRKLIVSSWDEEVINRTFYPGGQVLTETNGLRMTTRYILDGLNRVGQVEEEPEGEPLLITDLHYDGNGNPKEKTDRRGVKQSINTMTSIDSRRWRWKVRSGHGR